MSIFETPRGERLHIGIFGRRNAGKSSLINAMTGQNIAIVSDVPGTTTDPVYKAMEISGIGPVVFIDTAGFDDVGGLGVSRAEKSKLLAKRADIALVLFDDEDMISGSENGKNDSEKIFGAFQWSKRLTESGSRVIAVISKCDERKDGGKELADFISREYPAIRVSAVTGEGLDGLRTELIKNVPEDFGDEDVTCGLAAPGSCVLLVTPQDIQAPKGRLILPQVQTIRALLDKDANVVCCTAGNFEKALSMLKAPPDLIITDSQVFGEIYEKKPPKSALTSFSVLFAAYKGDIKFFTESVKKISGLRKDARILIAEACTHHPVEGDIGREKIPALLKKMIGDKIEIDFVRGADFPEDLSGYDMIIQCGACMFNRRFVLNRASEARRAGAPMTNYGLFLAYAAGIIDKITLPKC